jgi:hypothetical protein
MIQKQVPHDILYQIVLIFISAMCHLLTSIYNLKVKGISSNISGKFIAGTDHERTLE